MGILIIARNALSILTSDVFNRATTFFIYLMVARYLGAFEFGQMSLALTLFYTFQVISAAGLKTLLIREIAKDKIQTGRYLINAAMLVTVFSFLSLLILLGFTYLMGYQRETTAIILLLCLGLLPYSLASICEAVFQAWERMHFIACANVPANLLKLTLAYFLLMNNYGIWYLVILILACYLLVMILEWWVIFHFFVKLRFKFDFPFAVALTQKAFTFLGIDSVIAIWSSLNILIISRTAQEIDVGLYNASVQITIPVNLLFQSIALSIFPVLSQMFSAHMTDFKRVAQEMIELMLCIAMPCAIGLFFLSDLTLVLLYGEKEFLQASQVLRIIVWTLIPTALTISLGYVLITGLKEKITLRIVTVNLVINLVLGIILIHLFGLIGAAVTAVICGIVNFFQHYFPVIRILRNLNLLKLAWKPALASGLMAVYLAAMKSTGLVLTILPAAIIYFSSLSMLMIWSQGGLDGLKAKYLNLLLK